MSRIQKLFRGSALNTASLMVNVAILFFLFPFIVDKLGTRFYGLWELVCSLTGYYFLMDFGISQAVSRFIARAIGRQSHDDLMSVMSNSFILFSIMSVISLFVTFFILIATYSFVSSELRGTTQVLIAIVGLEFAISLPLRVYLSTLQAHLDFDVLSGAEIAKVIVRSILIVLFLSNGYGIVVLAVINIAVNILFLIFIFAFARNKYQTKLQFSHIQRGKMLEIFHFSKYVFLDQIGTMMRFRIDQFIIAGFLGLTSVTVYAVAMKITDLFIRFMTAITGVLNPLFSQYEGKQDFQSMRNAFLIGIRISTIISLFVGANIIIYGKFFIDNWMGKAFAESYPVLVILTISLSIALSQSIGIGVLRSMNKHKFYAITNMTEAFANLVLTLLLVNKFGMIGVALGTAIPMIIVKIFLQPFVVCKCIQLAPRTILGEMSYLLPILILFFSGVYYLVHIIIKAEFLSYSLLALHLLIQSSVYLVIVYALLAQKERGIVLMLLGQNKA